MREGDVALVLRALKLEVRVALGKDAVVGVGAELFGAAEREEAGRSLLTLPLRLESRDQDVADCDDDRAADGEQAGVEQGQAGANGQPRAAAHIRYPLPITVSISGGSPSLRRSRVIVTETMLLNGSDVRVPHVLEQLLGADQRAVGGQQHLQDPELLAGERERPRAAVGAVPGTVDAEVAVAQDRRRGRRPARERPHAGDELGEHEWLAEVVVRA